MKCRCFIVVILVIFYLCLFGCKPNNSNQKGSTTELKKTTEAFFKNISMNTQKLPMYEMFEAAFDLETVFSNGDQYNPDICDIRAYFTTPSGEKESIPAFFKKQEAPCWAIRYSPREEGTYQFYLQDEKSGVKSETLSFSSDKAGENRGFISASKNKLMDSYNKQFTILGTNYCWGDPDEYKSIIPVYKEHNMNFIRFWSNCDWSPYALESKAGVYKLGTKRDIRVEHYGLGNYSLGNAERFDTLIEQFEKNDVYMMFCLFNLWDFDAGHWAKNPYNKLNKGPCTWKENDTDYWSNPVAIKYQKQLIRYIAARWGYSRAIAIFELWNECDNKVYEENREIRDSWHKEMSDYWKSLDIYGRPVTTSYAWTDHIEFCKPLEQDPQPKEPWYSQGFLDIANVHCYLEDNKDPVQDWIDQLTFTKKQHPGEKPVFIGEYAEANSETWGFSPRKERYFLEGFWSPIFFADAAGSNLHWRINQKFMPDEKMLDYAKYAGEFISPFEDILPELEFIYGGIMENNLRVGYYKNETMVLMYVRDEQSKFNDEEVRTVKDANVEIPDMVDGEYMLSYYDPYTGEESEAQKIKAAQGILKITLPSFERSIAVKVKS